jgi:hypothetical protein
MDRRIEVLEMIAKDAENDATEFDGKPFNGKTVAEYFGNQGAAIAALANILKSLIEAESDPDRKNEQTVTRDVDHCTCTHPARWAGSVSNYCAKCDKPLRA